MKIKTTFQYLLFFSTILILSSCSSDDDETIPPVDNSKPYISTDGIFGCTNHKNIDISVDGNIKEFIEFNGAFVFATFDDLQIKNANGGSELEEDLNVNSFYRHDNNNLFICATEGIYQLNENLILKKRSEQLCRIMKINPEGKVLFTTGLGANSHHLYELNPIDYSTSRFTEIYNPSDCVSLGQFEFMANGNIWSTTCAGRILIFSSTGEKINEITNQNLFANSAGLSNSYLIPFEESMIIIYKNGPTYKVLKYVEENLIVLKDFNDGNESEKVTLMRQPTLTDAYLRDDIVYVSTTFAGCNGIQAFKVQKNILPLEEQDYYMIQDPSLPSQCVDRIIESENGDIYILTGQSTLTLVNC